MSQTYLILHFLQAQKQVLVEQHVVAGRSSRCDLFLPPYFIGETDTISGIHFKITRWASGQYFILDLGSANGTWLNGERLKAHEAHELHTGDIIQLTLNNEFRIMVRLEAPRPTDEVTSATLALTMTQRGEGIRYDENRRHFYINNQPVPQDHLNEQEHDLLYFLCQHEDTVCTFYEIERVVWGISVPKNTLTQKVVSLRRKLDEIVAGSGRKYIQSVHGRGYRYSKRV